MTILHFLIFDLDGTLVDSVPDLTTSLNVLRKELDSPPVTAQRVAEMVGDGVSMLVKRALGDTLFLPGHVDRFMEIYDQHILDNTSCYPGIEELFSRHSAEHMALVTNKPYMLTMKLLDGLNLTQNFKKIIGGDSFTEKKPHPLPVLKALEALDADPRQTVMIGDHHTDLRAGQGAGTMTCFCNYGMGHTDGLFTDFRAEQSTDLLRLFPGSHGD